MKKKILVSSVLFALFIPLFVSKTIFGAETGTVKFKAMDSTGQNVNNLEVKIYKVANHVNLSDEKLSNIQEYVPENVKEFLTVTTNDDGEFTLNNVETRKVFICSK